MAERGAVRIRDARAEEFGRIGELRVAAYRADGFLSETSTYLLTRPEMRAAQHLYAGAGFRRLPGRDYEYAPGHRLLAFGMALAGG